MLFFFLSPKQGCSSCHNGSFILNHYSGSWQILSYVHLISTVKLTSLSFYLFIIYLCFFFLFYTPGFLFCPFLKPKNKTKSNSISEKLGVFLISCLIFKSAFMSQVVLVFLEGQRVYIVINSINLILLLIKGAFLSSLLMQLRCRCHRLIMVPVMLLGDKMAADILQRVVAGTVQV